MKKLLTTLPLLALCAHAELLPLADFATNTDGFDNAATHRAEEGRGFIVLENNAGGFIQTSKDLHAIAINREVAAFQFQVRSENTGRIAARLSDATG